MTDTQKESRFDLVIAGGGMVGLCLARALARSPLRVALVDATAHHGGGKADYDDRSTALSPSSRRILTAMDCWEAVEREAASIRRIHVSDQGGFGMTTMTAEEEGLDALGHVVPNRILLGALSACTDRQPNLTVYRPMRVAGVRDGAGDCVRLSLTGAGGDATLVARVLVVADGSRSALREQLGIRARETAYGQTGIIANVTPSLAPEGRAFERFTRAGPLAMLPLPGGHCSLVWTVRDDDAERLLGLSDDAFLVELQSAFGFRLGRFLRVGRRSAWPLNLIRSVERRRGRAIVVGNAARTLHPVAGQGFNLALRDVAELAERVHEAALAGEDPGTGAVLNRYLEARVSDDRRVVTFTDGLVRLFSNRLPGVRLARNLGLVALELLPGGRRWLMRQAMGRAGRPSRLARGLPLRQPPGLGSEGGVDG